MGAEGAYLAWMQTPRIQDMFSGFLQHNAWTKIPMESPVQRQWREFQVVEMPESGATGDVWPKVLLMLPNKSATFVPGTPRIGTGVGAIYIIVDDQREIGNEWPTAIEVARRRDQEVLRQIYRPAGAED